MANSGWPKRETKKTSTTIKPSTGTIPAARLWDLAKLVQERAGLEAKMAELDGQIGPEARAVYAELQAGKLPAKGSPELTISVDEKRTVAWKQEFISVRSEEEAASILNATEAVKYHYLVVNMIKTPHSIETFEKKAEEAAKRAEKEARKAAKV